MAPRSSLWPAAAAAGAVLLWSTNAYAAGLVLAHVTVLQLLTVQYGSAAVALVALKAVLVRRRRARGPAAATSGAASGAAVGAGPARSWSRAAPVLVGVLGLTGTIFLQYLAFDTAPLVGANVICYADGLLAAIWVAAWRPTRHTLLGVPLALLGFAGVIVVFTDRGLGGLGGIEIGYLFALGSAVGMAFYSLASGRLAISTFGILIPATTLGALLALGLSLGRGETWPAMSDWAGAIYIGLGPMAAGYALWTFAMADGRADRLVPLSYATPLLSTGLLLATGQPFTTRTLLGAALILLCSTGVLLNQWLYSHGPDNPRPPPRTRTRRTHRPTEATFTPAASPTDRPYHPSEERTRPASWRWCGGGAVEGVAGVVVAAGWCGGRGARELERDGELRQRQDRQ